MRTCPRPEGRFSVWEIWGCLLSGGRLVVVPYFVSGEPGRFRDLLVAEQVTLLSQIPSASAQLLDVHTDVSASAARGSRSAVSARRS